VNIPLRGTKGNAESFLMIQYFGRVDLFDAFELIREFCSDDSFVGITQCTER